MVRSLAGEKYRFLLQKAREEYIDTQGNIVLKYRPILTRIAGE